MSDLIFVSWFRKGTTRYWYIVTIAIFYLLFPPIYRFIHTRNQGLLKTVIFCICWLITVEMLCNVLSGIGVFRIALARVPIFVVGVYCGKLSFEKVEINKIEQVLSLLIGYVAFMALKNTLLKPLSVHLYYPVRGLLCISIIVTFIMIMEFTEHRLSKLNNILLNLLEWFGGLTLELYLLHQSFLILSTILISYTFVRLPLLFCQQLPLEVLV